MSKYTDFQVWIAGCRSRAVFQLWMFHAFVRLSQQSEITLAPEIQIRGRPQHMLSLVFIQGSNKLPESLFLFFDIRVQNMNINKNVDSKNSRKYVLSSCIPRSRPSSFLLSRLLFLSTFISTMSPPMGTQFSSVPCDTIWTSRRFRRPSSKRMRNAMHHLLMTLWSGGKNTRDQTETMPPIILRYRNMQDLHTSNVFLSTGLNILKQSSVDAFSSPYIWIIATPAQCYYVYIQLCAAPNRVIDNRLTDLKGERHWHLCNVIQVVSCCTMCKISGKRRIKNMNILDLLESYLNATVELTELQGVIWGNENMLDVHTQQIHHLTQLGSYLGNGDGSNSPELTASNAQRLHLVWYSCDHMA